MRLWILHCAKGEYREAVIILDETTIEDIGLDPDDEICASDLEAEFLGGGWEAEGLLEVSVEGGKALLPYGNLLERAW